TAMDGDDRAAAAPAPARLKIAGAWTGVLDVRLDSWTLPMLRAEVARRSGGADPACVNLICGGKVLRDGGGGGDASLLQLGVKNNAKVLATCVSADRGKALNAEAAAESARAAAEAEQSKKLNRIWEAAKALAQRHSDGSLPLEDYNIELEDQSGQKVMFVSESDKRAVMMGLMLHANAKSLINKQKYEDALDVLAMAEEAFSLCDARFIEMIDNVPILQLDTVWCYFMLRDVSCLSVAGDRLAKARKGFERSHGKDSKRFRVLQDGRHAELAIYVRLELLEGVVAYHSGDFEAARRSLTSAQTKYMQLQVPDEALSLLMGMGYRERAAKRALRMTGQDVQSAVDFLVEERAKKARRREEDVQRHDDIMEQKRYGKTPNNKAVDLQRLKELVSIGFEKYLAAEALRINENDAQKALDLLTDPEQNCALQSRMELRKQKATKRTDQDVVQRASGVDDHYAGGSNPPEESQEGSSAAAATTADNQEDDNMNEQGEEDREEDEEGDEEEQEQAKKSKSGRDVEMEDELADKLTGDPFADYDIEVAREGEAIAEYMSLLESTSSAS
ncbi:NEDD8 ultimate buster 1, partial [Ananas comosus]